jgi:cyclopropane-fatty-acyl-phospholipid synthase
MSPNEIALGEAFIHRDLDVEGDIFSVFSVAEHILNRQKNLHEQIIAKSTQAAFGLRQWVANGRQHSQARDRAAISHHYNQPVEFFRPWLGKSLAYSCAYFRNSEDPLDLAQEQKLALICEKLRILRGERFLDIGCGWGSLPICAARHYGASALGITLSHAQYEEARRRINVSGLGNRCEVVLCDYRRLDRPPHSFDKIASVGMFEHIGLRNLRQYFRTVRGWLRPGGLFLNHGIARAYDSPPRKNSFIDRYVFPDGQLVTLSQAMQAAEAEGLEIRDVENLRDHYELTLRRWVAALQANADEILRHASHETYRVWILYMTGSAAAFRRGSIAVFQVLLSRADKGISNLPLTREDWYAKTPDQERVEV